MTKPLVLSLLGLPLSEKQIPQVVENIENGWKSRQALERAGVRPRQVRYPAALRPDFIHSTSLPKRGALRLQGVLIWTHLLFGQNSLHCIKDMLAGRREQIVLSIL